MRKLELEINYHCHAEATVELDEEKFGKFVRAEVVWDEITIYTEDPKTGEEVKAFTKEYDNSDYTVDSKRPRLFYVWDEDFNELQKTEPYQ